jgi:ABC-type glycerol-3-phosphate transport system substrate-binding protein
MKPKNRIKTLSRAGLALISAAALALTSCAQGPSAQETPGAQGEDGQVVLNAIFLPADWGRVVQEILAPQYEAETGVKVNVELIGRDAIYERMAILFAGQDSSYDIFNLDYNWIPEFGEGGHLVPMGDVLGAEDLADFHPLSIEVSTWNGELLAIPQTIHPATLWYNSALYLDPQMQADYKAETGADLAPPESFDEWFDQVKFFDGREFNGQELSGWAAQAAKGFGNVHTWLSFAFSYGCQPFNADYTESTLSTPACIEATERWAEMMQYMPAGANEFTYDNVTASAQQGTIATAIQWSWGAFAVDNPEASQTVGQWEMVPMPGTRNAAGSGHLAAWVISVSKYSKHVEEAKAFVAWLETKENDILQAKNGAGDPVRISSYESADLTTETLADSSALRFRRLPVVLEAMKSAQPRPFFPGEESWETTLSTELSAISLGESSVEEALARADEAQNKNLAR